MNCRYQASLKDVPTFNGDRILVMKFPYDMPFLPGASEPQRWDVVVFRYPEEPEISYIKRLVGLSGEELRIWFGDVYIRLPGEQGVPSRAEASATPARDGDDGLRRSPSP